MSVLSDIIPSGRRLSFGLLVVSLKALQPLKNHYPDVDCVIHLFSRTDIFMWCSWLQMSKYVCFRYTMIVTMVTDTVNFIT